MKDSIDAIRAQLLARKIGKQLDKTNTAVAYNVVTTLLAGLAGSAAGKNYAAMIDDIAQQAKELAGLSFISPWKCLTCSANDYRDVVMQNMNTGEIRECTGAEILENGEIQWAASKELGDYFTVKLYEKTGKNKQSITRLDWNWVLHFWKQETMNHYPAPTIWLGGNRLVDGPILLEAYED